MVRVHIKYVPLQIGFKALKTGFRKELDEPAAVLFYSFE
jgi:hypothetical protein